MRRIPTMLAATAAMGLLATSMLVTPALAGPPDAGQSACGGLIAYNQETAGPNSSQLMAVPAAGGTPRVLWDRTDAVEGELDPAWSPDGRSVAFAGRLTDASGVLMDNRLYVLRAGAAAPEIVVNQLGQRGGLRFPAWSPDGRRIAYITGVPPTDQSYRGLAWVHIVDLTTGQDDFLTGFPEPLVTPDLAWSPRGDQLLVTTLNPINFHWSIYSVRPDPADPRPTVLISDDAGARSSTGFPAFLPGGGAVLVEQDETDGTASRLYLSDPKFKYLVPVTERVGWETQPDFGASPLQAVYQRYNDERTETSIKVLGLVTGRTRTLVPPATGVYVEQPDWQPVIGCRPWPSSF